MTEDLATWQSTPWHEHIAVSCIGAPDSDEMTAVVDLLRHDRHTLIYVLQAIHAAMPGTHAAVTTFEYGLERSIWGDFVTAHEHIYRLEALAQIAGLRHLVPHLLARAAVPSPF